jgi:hypothetical protein
MNDQVDLEQRVSRWLESEARGELPDWVLDEALTQTRTEPRQTPFATRLRSLRRPGRPGREPHANRGITMFTTLRAAVVALLIGIVGLGAALVISVERSSPPVPAAESAASIEPVELLDLTFDGGIIPEEFVGVLFSRKAYPTDQEITYTNSFLPPNTFIRQVESGELRIRPNDVTQVIRAGKSQAEAEVVGAGEETIVGPGDTFIQRDVPWAEFGKDALGEMWTPGEDAVIFSLAIREQDRCCAMSHPGMRSRWYHTLTGDIADLAADDLRFLVQRWELPAGQSLTYTAETTPSIWAVDAGEVAAMTAADAAAGNTAPRPTRADFAIWLMTTSPGTDVVVDNVGEETAVLYQLIVEPAPAA